MNEEDIKQGLSVLLPQAPKPVQEFILNGLSPFVLDLTIEYALHVDQGGVVERELLLMLLGQETPTDFSVALKESGIAPEDVRSILLDVNEKIFKKIQKQELSGSERVQRTAPLQSLISEPSIESAKIIKSPVPEISNLKPSFVDTPTASPVPTPTMRTMQHDMDLIQHGAAPAPYPAPASLHPAQATPARMFQTASVPVTAHPVQAAIDHEMIHIVPDKPARASTALPPAPIQVPQVASMKEYSSDPYRESI